MLDDFVSRCQSFAERITDVARQDLGGSLQSLIQALPSNLSVPERLVARHLIGKTVARVAILIDSDRRNALAAALMRWESSYTIDGQWQCELERFADACAAACESPGPDRVRGHAWAPRVEHLIDLIGRRFSDHELSLSVAASECGASVWHTARILKQTTGSTFSDHLHRLRIDAARRLLAESTLSVKEIAARVGYGSSSRLGVHFKRLCGSTPVAYRTARASTCTASDRLTCESRLPCAPSTRTGHE